MMCVLFYDLEKAFISLSLPDRKFTLRWCQPVFPSCYLIHFTDCSNMTPDVCMHAGGLTHKDRQTDTYTERAKRQC